MELFYVKDIEQTAQRYFLLDTNEDKESQMGLRPVATDHNWSALCTVTQDIDELNEYIYINKLNLQIKPKYFDPKGKWVYITQPKIKLRWHNRIRQCQIGKQLYNIVPGTWDVEGNSYIPDIEENKCVCKIKTNQTIENPPSKTLIPFRSYYHTELGYAPNINIEGHRMECVYPLVHYHVHFNRQGLYVNRKYREKIDLISLEELGDDFLILDPIALEITDQNNVTHCLNLK